VAAFISVYIIWGSTYLAIKFAIDTVPPFLMAGARFLAAGLILYAFARARGAARPTAINWRAAAVVGGLLLLTGNGLVSWGEQAVPSGLAALLISTVPLWMALIEWRLPGGTWPTLPVMLGILLGLGGVALLFGPGSFAGGKGVSLLAAAIIVLASMSWAAGSLYSRRAPLAASAPLSNGMEMVAGGALLLVLGLVTGEGGQLHLDHISLRSALALLYLIVFGSIVAFSAYIYMLKTASVARVSTYAYVNPVVAVLLGVAFNGEQLTPLTLIAAAVIVAAVVVITTFRARGGTQAEKAPTMQPQMEHEPPLSREQGVVLSSQ
jgi:drug/metabolite transporter (DMT)-like permease